MQKLLDYQKKINDLQYLINILNWELRTISPEDSLDYLIEVKNKLEIDLFKLKTSSDYKDVLLDVINKSEILKLSEPELRYIKNQLNRFEKNAKVPEDFYKEYKKVCSISNRVWKEAKATNDFELFKPHLQKNIEMTKEYYSYIDPSRNLYDVMLDEYEMGMTSDVIDKLFGKLKEVLIPLIKKAQTSSEAEYLQNYNNSELIDCAKYLLNYIGFDMKRGALGIYPHGFTEKMASNDVRIAFEHTNNPVYFVSTIIHEGGHGIFEQNITEQLSKYENGCIENLYGLHESQSRFYENILGRNINFWYPIYDNIKEMLKLDINLEEFVVALNTVKVGKIRTEADELTYCLHIIIRYEIERDIFSSKISIDDLPNIWNKKMKEYLDVDITNDREGLMQDVHWSECNFGYFPSYLLGSIYDGMLKDAVEEKLGSIDALLKDGNVKLITEFLINNIYKYGGAYNSKEVIEKICKKPLSVDPIIKYFNEKYN